MSSPSRVWPCPQQRHGGGPLVSVVVPSFNYGRYLPETVASIKAQTFADIEILIVDGGSTDGETREVAAGLADDRVQVFLREGRHTTGANRNFGAERARGRYVCCVDSDDRLAPTYVEKAVFLAEHYGFDVVGSSVRFFGAEEGVWTVGRRVDLRELMQAYNPVSTHALFRRDLWARIGGYRDHGDGSSATYVYEDWEFWTRMAAAGARFHNMHRDHGLFHRVHPSSLSRREGMRSYGDHARTIAKLNADELTPQAVRRSGALRRTPLRVTEPLVNLVPDAPTRDAGGPADPRSLLVIVPYMQVGGAERLLATVLDALARDDWTIAVVSTRPDDPAGGDAAPWFERATPAVFKLTDFLPDSACWPDFLDYLVASRRISRVLIAGSAYAYADLPRLKRRHGHLRIVDLVFNTQSTALRHLRDPEPIDATIVEAEPVGDWLVEQGRARERIVTVPSGVDLDLHRPRRDVASSGPPHGPGAEPPLDPPLDPGPDPAAEATADPASGAWRASLGAAPDDVVVAFAGRWSPNKNPLGFVAVAAALRDVMASAGGSDEGRVRCVMMGSGAMEDAVREAVDAAGFPEGGFHLLGAVDDLGAILPECDILVVPSTVDGRPQIILEALASGVPVLASRVGGIPDLVVAGRYRPVVRAGGRCSLRRCRSRAGRGP